MRSGEVIVFIDGEMSVGWHGERAWGEQGLGPRVGCIYIRSEASARVINTCISEGYREVVDMQRQVVSEARHVDQDVNRAWEVPRGKVRVKQDTVALRVREGGNAVISLPRLLGDSLQGRGDTRSCRLRDRCMRFIIFVYAIQYTSNTYVKKEYIWLNYYGTNSWMKEESVKSVWTGLQLVR